MPKFSQLLLDAADQSDAKCVAWRCTDCGRTTLHDDRIEAPTECDDCAKREPAAPVGSLDVIDPGAVPQPK